jgi:transcriptional regulator with XRE-family HTH domain
MSLCLTMERVALVRGKQRNPTESPLGHWIDKYMDMRGFATIRGLAKAAGVSGARITQLRQGDTTKPYMIEQIARAFVPEGLSDEESQKAYQRLYNEGFRAAFPLEGEMEPDSTQTPVQDALATIIEALELDTGTGSAAPRKMDIGTGSEMKTGGIKSGEIGERMRARREYLGLTQAQVGRAIGKDRSSYAQYESGINTISAETLREIAQVLKTSAAYLFGEQTEGDVARHEIVRFFEGLPPRIQQAEMNHLRALHEAHMEEDGIAPAGGESNKKGGEEDSGAPES